MPEQMISAAAKTAKDILRKSGLHDIEVTDEDAAKAEATFQAYTNGNGSSITPASLDSPEAILKIEALVTTYDRKIIQHADQIRLVVTNKLLELAANKDPKVQLKAVELLGKLADVGMFVEKQEITYKQRSDEEIDAILNEKLGMLIEGDFTTETEPVKKSEKPVTKPVENASKGTMDVAPLPTLPKIDLDSLLDA